MNRTMVIKTFLKYSPHVFVENIILAISVYTAKPTPGKRPIIRSEKQNLNFGSDKRNQTSVRPQARVSSFFCTCESLILHEVFIATVLVWLLYFFIQKGSVLIHGIKISALRTSIEEELRRS